MVPVSLKLSNFTSYGSDVPVLDFTKFEMAVISGTNGVGKSSILDSITWALWGWSRAGDSSDALVKLGQEEMFVEFSFSLDGNIYTVKRRRSLKHGGSTALELWSGSHNLTEGTIKATQNKIIELLHLTIETFTNSSFLRQGHADEFTTKGATDRKRILANILGLDHYDLIEEKAKNRAKEIGTKIQLLEYSLLEIEATLSQKEEREKALSLAEEETKQVEKDLREIELSIKEVEELKQTLTSKIDLLKEKKSQIESVKREIADLQLQIEVKEKAKHEYQTILEQKQTIEENLKKLQQFQEQKKLLEEKRSELINLRDKSNELQKVIVQLEERRNSKVTQLEVEIKRLQTENEQTKRQNDHLKEHKDSCPTCGQTIGKDKNEEILKQNGQKISENNLKLKVVEEDLRKCKSFELKEKKEADELDLKVKELDEQTKQWSEILLNISSLEKYTDLNLKLQQAENSLKGHEETIIDLQKMLTDKKAQISQQEQQLSELSNYEAQLLDIKGSLMRKESERQDLSQKHTTLTGKVGAAKQLVSQTEQLETNLKQKSEEKAKLVSERSAYDELALAFGKKGIQAMIIETAIPELEEEANSLLDRLTEGRMKVRLETLKETKTKVAGGERGIVETLDIIISDEMGERAYEMYSGGEAFRVNFAIRLALSKLLARRAGAKLQFLVIDEGFGTQDAQGRTRIVEVLDVIKHDFEKIVIITHIDELKEEFPTRIEVSKGTNGSTFEIVGG